ncbi:hypothetical protein DICSQDRAFT_183175 [Dichomitus squalens LYAD-421 SS1]|uniref:Uncharacterized protein n=1 Tax=Dichomitus squalens (strain LYAD-421) TaxID=732165 RepID=R7SR43_DICSQ|nr:uncharacterized protein DICSQDRAFT_183175 [Dichomitus squalens LYAD-421 SS1]EJF57452.1 hypothetical protein DICSQDRAFT_183175 [Dichomitus squalens LYAD-421 SS1]
MRRSRMAGWRICSSLAYSVWRRKLCLLSAGPRPSVLSPVSTKRQRVHDQDLCELWLSLRDKGPPET